MKFRKKPVVIEAVQWTGNTRKILEMLDRLELDHMVGVGDGNTLVIRTLGGDITAQKGDWIIRGVRGELYPCSRDIFEETYEEVED